MYIFDKYLNRTMNWAYRIIEHTPGIKPIVTAPLIVKNEFYSQNIEFLFSPYQWGTAADEWDFSPLQVVVSKATVKIPFLYKRFLKKKIRELKPDLIHIHYGTTAWEYSALAQEMNIPLIATFHGYDYRLVLHKKPVFKTRYRDLFARAAAVTCGGQEARKYLISIGSFAEKTYRIPMAIETEKILLPVRNKKKGNLNILQISSFTPKKGQIYTLHAFKEAVKSNKNLKLTFLGEFMNKSVLKEVREFIRKHDLRRFVTILASVPYLRLLEILPNFDIFIHPSVTTLNHDIECTPVSIMDAQCAGLPVISTFHSDIPDIVKHNKTGILLPEKDINGLTKAILKFAKMEEGEISEWRKAARNFMKEEFDISQVGKKWRLLYENVSEEGKSR